MEKMKLLIADGNEEFCKALESALQDEFCILIASDGNAAVTLLDSFRPEVLVLDVMLSGLDGIRVLEYAAQRGHKLKTLVTVSWRSDYIFTRLTRLGVSYVLLKPCALTVTAERVREIAADAMPIAPQSGEQILANALLDLNISPRHNGCRYLHTAVELYAGDDTQSLTKELYVAVGAVYGVSAQQVERSIRAALEAAWKCRDEKLWRQWISGIGALKRPTNGQVISSLAQHLQLEKRRKIG